MMTIFAMPKAFRGHIGMIQRNAIKSWTLLRPRPEIILFGSDEGTAETAEALGLRHIADVASNEYGTPLLGDLFRQAEANAKHETMCYVNADIVVMNDFVRALGPIGSRWKGYLAISERIDMDVAQPIDFDGDWETPLKEQARTGGKPVGYTGIDIFVFPKGTYPRVPDFALGRLWFDQWLIKAARESGTPVVDLTRVAPVIHQNHDYSHVAGGKEQVWRGKEAEVNLRLYAAAPHAYTFLDVTHEMLPGGEVRRVWLRKEKAQAKTFVWKALVQRTARVRHALNPWRKSAEAREG